MLRYRESQTRSLFEAGLASEQALKDETKQDADGLAGYGVTHTVATIRKRPGANAFSGMVTIGRARNNDIEVKSAGVSKFHAYVLVDRDGTTSLTDAGSTNGTFVNDEQVEERGRIELRPGDQILLGSVRGHFHTPVSLYDYLQSVRVSPPPV